jgi:hypothetical protein
MTSAYEEHNNSSICKTNLIKIDGNYLMNYFNYIKLLLIL